MSGSAVVFMLVVCSFVWGGFLLLLVRAVRSEGRKSTSN
jgi:hypothetical protein